MLRLLENDIDKVPELQVVHNPAAPRHHPTITSPAEGAGGVYSDVLAIDSGGAVTPALSSQLFVVDMHCSFLRDL